jgi:hypothetical protein
MLKTKNIVIKEIKEDLVNGKIYYVYELQMSILPKLTWTINPIAKEIPKLILKFT